MVASSPSCVTVALLRLAVTPELHLHLLPLVVLHLRHPHPLAHRLLPLPRYVNSHLIAHYTTHSVPLQAAGDNAAAGGAVGNGGDDPQTSLTLVQSVIATGFAQNGQTP